MRFFKNTDKKAMKETSKLLMTGKVRKGYRAYCAAVLAMTVVLGTGVTALRQVTRSQLSTISLILSSDLSGQSV